MMKAVLVYKGTVIDLSEVLMIDYTWKEHRGSTIDVKPSLLKITFKNGNQWGISFNDTIDGNLAKCIHHVTHEMPEVLIKEDVFRLELIENQALADWDQCFS